MLGNADASGASALVVDDDSNIRSAVSALLRKMGVSPTEASSASEALAFMDEQTFELLITDLQMPGPSGLELLRRAGQRDPDMAMLMLTGVDDPDVADQAFDLGVFGYMVKPFQLNELRILVANALRRRVLEIARRSHLDDLEREVARRTDELHRTAAALTARERHFRSLVTSSPMGILRSDPGGNSQYANGRAADILHGSDVDLVGTNWLDLLAPAERHRTTAALRSTATTGHRSSLDVRLGAGPTGERWVTIHLAPVDDAEAEAGILVLLEDITHRKGLEQRLHHQAAHDHLTGLANRRWLEARLEYALGGLQSGVELGVAVFDLDQFKLVNDTYGHAAGDQLIVEVARRLKHCCGPDDEVARFGGDEFVILVRRGNSTSVADAVRDVHRNLVGVVKLRDGEVFVSASVGLATTTTGEISAATILGNADIAMHRAKESGRSRVEIFGDQLRDEVARKLMIANQLRRALDDRTFRVEYQPQFDVRTGSLIGIEALARWPDDAQMVAPDEFIPVAEASGIVHLVDRYVLHAACSQLATWIATGAVSPTATVGVNVSSRQLGDSDFVQLLKATLASTGLRPTALVLELTESILLTDLAQTFRVLAQIRGLGVQVAIDDFGTGYSSLSYLRELPVDQLKIDRAFVETLAGPQPDPRDVGMVAAITELAHHFGLTVIAEGVERVEQLHALRRLGCDVAQGYLLARPMAVGNPELTEILRSGTARRVEGKPDNAAASVDRTLPHKAPTLPVVPVSEPPMPTPIRPTVVVADDSEILRTAFRRALERAGFTVLEACNGSEALDAITDGVGLVIVDNHMPDMTGLDVLDHIRADEVLRSMPVVLATGTSIEHELARAAAANVDRYLLKPVDLEALVQVAIELTEREPANLEPAAEGAT